MIFDIHAIQFSYFHYKIFKLMQFGDKNNKLMIQKYDYEYSTNIHRQRNSSVQKHSLPKDYELAYDHFKRKMVSSSPQKDRNKPNLVPKYNVYKSLNDPNKQLIKLNSVNFVPRLVNYVTNKFHKLKRDEIIYFATIYSFRMLKSELSTSIEQEAKQHISFINNSQQK